MNHAQIKALANYYDVCIEKDRELESVNHAENLSLVVSHESLKDWSLEHARWMCGKIQGMDDLYKMNRWVGFIQCILMRNEMFSLDELRMHSAGGAIKSEFSQP